MQATRTPKAVSKLAAVPLPVWIVGLSSWALVARRLIAELFF